MNMLDHAPIARKMLITLIVPVLALVLALGWTGLQSREKAIEAAQLETLSRFTVDLSALIHNMQRERGATATFLSSRGAEMRDTLPGLRQATDTARRDFARALERIDVASYSPRFQSGLEASLGQIRLLDANRQRVDAMAVSPADAAGYYTATIGGLLDVAGEGSKASSSSRVSNAVVAYLSFMAAKERAGQERATGAAGLAAGQFTPAQFNTLVGLISVQDALFRNFEVYGTPDLVKAYQDTMRGGATAELQQLRQAIIQAGAGARLDGVSAQQWFETATRRIDAIKTVEDKIALDLGQTALGIERDASRESWLVLVGAGLILVVSGMVAWGASRSIIVPIRNMTRAMQQLAAGDLGVMVHGGDRRDEIGAMARATQVFKEAGIEKQRLEAEQARLRHEREEAEAAARREKEAAEQAARDREEAQRQAAERDRKAMLNQLAQDLDTVVGSLVTTVSAAATQLQGAAQDMSEAASETSRQSTAVASAAEQSSASIQTVASATEELAASVQEIGRQAQQSSEVSEKAVEQAQVSTDAVTGMVTIADRISGVIEIINAIASQTNLLALNATIEAARAGDAGKGFAVVASEVKQLAGQTASATQEIAGEIQAIQSATKHSSAAIATFTGMVEDMSRIATSIASAVNQQSAATDEITRSVQDVAQGAQTVTTNIVGVTQAADRAGIGSAQVLDAARQLTGQAAHLRAQVDGFLTTLRQAA
ncbi:methyl-accepting chemotaxis protein [Parapedomonas caeni]